MRPNGPAPSIFVSRGSERRCHVEPPSSDVAQPISELPPPGLKRPTRKAETAVLANDRVQGATAVWRRVFDEAAIDFIGSDDFRFRACRRGRNRLSRD